jgi:hypothetical protein
LSTFRMRFSIRTPVCTRSICSLESSFMCTNVPKYNGTCNGRLHLRLSANRGERHCPISANLTGVAWSGLRSTQSTRDNWEQYVKRPFQAQGKQPPELHILPSPYRFVIIPVV